MKQILAAMFGIIIIICTVPTTATAATGATVFIGDSMFANPTYSQINPHNAPGGPFATVSSKRHTYAQSGTPSPRGCGHGNHSISRHLAGKYGYYTIDYSCSGGHARGTGDRDIAAQVTAAIEDQALDSGTRNVVVMAGLNDLLANRGAEDAVASSLTEQVTRIKAAAPNAHVVLSAYPAISGPAGQVCPIRVSNPLDQPGVNLAWPDRFKPVEDHANHALWRAAVNTNSTFYDLHARSLGHNMCVSNSQRWVASVQEFALPHNLASHLTHHGVNGVTDLYNAEVLH